MLLDYYLEKYAHILSPGSTIRTSGAFSPLNIAMLGYSASQAESGNRVKAFAKGYGKSVATGALKSFSGSIANAVGNGANWGGGFRAAGNAFMGKS